MAMGIPAAEFLGICIIMADNGQLAMYMTGWIGDYPSADNMAFIYCKSDGLIASYISYKDAEVDRMCDQTASETDQSKWQYLWDQIVTDVNNDYVYIFPS